MNTPFRPFGRTLLVLACVAAAAPADAATQDSNHFGIRGGAGTDLTGRTVYSGQIEFSETEGNHSVELAIAGFNGAVTQKSIADASSGRAAGSFFTEETDVVGIGLVANFLFRHAVDVSGPYFVVGGGVGAFGVEWILESPTAGTLETPRPGGGSFTAQDEGAFGSIVNLGVGQRITRFFDLRAQVPTLIVAGNDPRGLKLIPLMTLTASVGF